MVPLDRIFTGSAHMAGTAISDECRRTQAASGLILGCII
jgi:hypothetical protein